MKILGAYFEHKSMLLFILIERIKSYAQKYAYIHTDKSIKSYTQKYALIHIDKIINSFKRKYAFIHTDKSIKSYTEKYVFIHTDKSLKSYSNIYIVDDDMNTKVSLFIFIMVSNIRYSLT